MAGLLSGLRALRAPANRIRLGAYYGVHRRGHLSALTLRRHPNSLKSLSLSGEPWPDYGQQGWGTDNEEIQSPPTTHFVATIDDLTDMLDFNSEDIDGMDADEGDDEEPAPTRP